MLSVPFGVLDVLLFLHVPLGPKTRISKAHHIACSVSKIQVIIISKCPQGQFPKFWDIGSDGYPTVNEGIGEPGHQDGERGRGGSGKAACPCEHLPQRVSGWRADCDTQPGVAAREGSGSCRVGPSPFTDAGGISVQNTGKSGLQGLPTSVLTRPHSIRSTTNGIYTCESISDIHTQAKGLATGNDHGVFVDYLIC